MINGSTHAYPDIIAMTTSGKILMIEPKGDHLDGDDSKEKAKIGHQWDMLTSSQYRYFMVFESKSPDYPGAYSYERFMEIVKGLSKHGRCRTSGWFAYNWGIAEKTIILYSCTKKCILDKSGEIYGDA